MNIRKISFLLFGIFLAAFLALAQLGFLSDLASSEEEPAKSNLPFQPLSQQFFSSMKASFPAKLSGKILATATVDGYDRIILIDLDRDEIRAVIDGPGSNSFPSWAPDGKRFSFTSTRDGNQEIYTASIGDANVHRVTEFAGADDTASWYPSGDKVIFSRELSRKGSDFTADIFAAPATGGPAQRVTNFDKRNSTPQISPDGKHLALSTSRFWPGWDVCVVRLDDGRENCPLRGATTYCRPRFSNSGSKIAYSNGYGNKINAFVFDRKTKESHQISHFNGKAYDTTWDPTDSFIAFASDKDKKDRYNVYVSDPKTGEVVPILEGPYSVRYLDWSH